MELLPLQVPAFAPFRRILTEVDVRVIIEKGKPRRRRCILCNDVLLYLKAKKNGRFSSPAYRTLANLAACDIWDNGTGGKMDPLQSLPSGSLRLLTLSLLTQKHKMDLCWLISIPEQRTHSSSQMPPRKNNTSQKSERFLTRNRGNVYVHRQPV